MINKIEKYKLNAKKAYEFAAGFRVVNGENKTKRVHRKKCAGRPSCRNGTGHALHNELNSEEQKVFLGNCEYGFRYSLSLSKSRLAEDVEKALFEQVKTPKEIKYAIEYCNTFEISMPTCLHNKILMQTVIPAQTDGLNWKARYEVKSAERKQKKYLEKFQNQKKSFKIYLEGLMKNNNLCDSNTIKELIDCM